MFLAKLKLYHNDCPIVNRCVKFRTDVVSYPGNHYTKGGKEYVTTFCKFREADEEMRKKFLRDLKSDPQCTRLDVWGTNFLYEYALEAEGEHVMLYYTAAMTFVEPTLNSQDGHEYWTVATTDKETIHGFFAQLKKHMDVAKIVYVKEESDIDFAFPLVTQKLSKTQKKTLKIALEKGYYNFPRKCKLADIAKASGTSIATVQEHLRRAEAKILSQRLVI